MKPGLLDGNMMIALLHGDHPQHDDAHEWLDANDKFGWAACPTTINGCVRIMSNPAYGLADATPESIIRGVRQLCMRPGYQFWTDTMQIGNERIIPSLIESHKFVADVCILAAACAQGGRLVTFDRHIPWRVVAGAGPDDICLVGGPPVRR